MFTFHLYISTIWKIPSSIELFINLYIYILFLSIKSELDGLKKSPHKLVPYYLNFFYLGVLNWLKLIFKLPRFLTPLLFFFFQNPWIVLEKYSLHKNVFSVVASIAIPNAIFLISLIVLLYWYCPYCQARCRKYEEQTDCEEEQQQDNNKQDTRSVWFNV